MMKAYSDLGLDKAGIKFIGPGDITTDEELPNMGDVALGVITMHHYSAAADAPGEQGVRRRLEEGIRREILAELHVRGRVGRDGRDLPRRSASRRARSTPTGPWRW